MKVLELFAGTRSISKAFEEHGHETYTVEIDRTNDNISLYADILTVSADDILSNFGHPEVIWSSPPCTTYSVAGIHYHREQLPDGTLVAKSEFAKLSDELVKHTLDLINELNPRVWFIENPRGALRKMPFMRGLPRYTVTYCQYGDTRQKPTDIWTNVPDPEFKPMCHPKDKCHESAPRGSRTGTQGLKDARTRSIIPPKLCAHIVSICEPRTVRQHTLSDYLTSDEFTGKAIE